MMLMCKTMSCWALCARRYVGLRPEDMRVAPADLLVSLAPIST